MSDPPGVRVRREPPPFRRVQVVAVTDRTPRLRRITLGGPELEGFGPFLPAASARLLVPTRGPLELPAWDGNEFLLADGTRPAVRTVTPLAHRPDRHELDVEVVLHGEGPLSTWAADADPGAEAALSGPGRGYEVDPDAQRLLLVGDESALPAIATLLDALGGRLPVDVLVEVARPDARLALPGTPEVQWLDLAPDQAPGSALLAAMSAAELASGTHVWAAGEAAGVQRLRKHLFDERAWPRGAATVRGYWKVGRASGGT